MRVAHSLLVSSLLLMPLLAQAVSFPDIADYPHREAIIALAERGVIGGNPDGTFQPRKVVDRVSMLKMLYVAAGFTPGADKKNCFRDVQPGSWYESYVCDAVARGFVQGYEGNVFRPAQPVTRVEALKLTIVILGIPTAVLSAPVTMYTDVSASEWFAGYVHTSLATGMLPIPGQEGALLKPATPLERGEAAAYIWNGIRVKNGTLLPFPHPVTTSSVSSTSSTESLEAQRARQRVDEKSGEDEDKRNTRQVSFPFADSAVFSGTHSMAWRFRVDKAATTDVTAEITAGGGNVSCRLYRLQSDGLSTEYYLGMQEQGSCRLRVALTPGDYQLQLEPTKDNASVMVGTRTVTGDANDGFSQAIPLKAGQVKIGTLEANDLEDWYVFTVGASTSPTPIPGTPYTVKVVSSAILGCVIYPGADVDLFSFKGPECGISQQLTPGTYWVTIRHAQPRAERQTYSLELQAK